MGRHRSVASLRKILFTGRQARAHVSTAPLLTIELIDRRTKGAHRVTDAAFAVLPASLTAPARGHCPACEPCRMLLGLNVGFERRHRANDRRRRRVSGP
jgi:hypothetical protein